MSHLTTALRIEASPAAIFDLIADPARSPEWQTLLVEMGEIAGRSGGIGSSFVGYYRVAGRRLAARFIVTAADRPLLLQVNATTSGGWARWTTMLEPAGRACNVRVELEYELPGEIVGSLFGLLTGNRLERELRRTYENLKRLAEAPASSAVRMRSLIAVAGSTSGSASDESRGRGADDELAEAGERVTAV